MTRDRDAKTRPGRSPGDSSDGARPRRPAWIETVPEAEAEGELADLYHRFGFPVAHILRVSSVNPPVLRAHYELYRAIMYGSSPLTRAQREMIAVVVSLLNQCHYWMHQHGESLRQQQRGDSTVLRALLEDFHTAPISEAEHRMLAYAEQLTRDPSSVSEDQIHELRASGWGDGAIHDMAQVVAYYNYVNRVADGLGVTLEEGWPEQWPWLAPSTLQTSSCPPGLRTSIQKGADMPDLSIGNHAPNFELPDENGQPWILSAHLPQGPVVLVFYRGDWWPYCNGQLVSYARQYSDFEGRHAQVAGISVDSIPRNAAMVRKLLLPFPLLSDPEGAVIQRYGVWNEKERIAIPAIVVIDQADVIRYVYAGRDFADRPGDEAVFEALDKAGSEPVTPLGKPGIQVTAEEAETTPDRGRNAYTLENLVPYYRGVYFATVALKERLAARPRENRDAIREIGQYQQMVQRYSEALRETITMTRESEERTP